MNRGREIRLGVLGLLGILVLEIGIPAVLVRFVGYPLPRSAPSRDWLTQSISATLVIKILACAVWLAWAQFTVCVLSEWRALRRGRLPRNVALGGGSQLLARRLVAAALLLAGAATVFGNVASSAGARSSVATSRSVTSQQAAHGRGVAKAAGVDATGTEAGEPAAATGARQAVKYYVVEPPQGRNYDCLWDIAARTMGDPMRYKEIFELNKDRQQADGSRLVDANLIRPGWELRLPADASGRGVHAAHASAPARAGSAAATASTAATAAAAPSAAATAGSSGRASAATELAPAPSARSQSANPLDSALFGGGLMLAGILLALNARRGPYGDVTTEEESLTVGADPGLAASLDRALRHLAAARRAQGRELPQPIVAWASADDVSLNLFGGDLADPPAPWSLSHDGPTWNCRLADVVELPDVDDTAAPFPGLISVGRHDDYEVFVDFEQAPGLVSIGGDIGRGRELATSLAVQAVTSAWSDGARVTLVGFANGAELARIDPRSIDQVARLDTVLDSFEQEQDGVRHLQRELGVDGVLEGRLARRSTAWRPRLVVLSGPPTVEEVRRLQALVGDGRSPFIAIVVGDTHTARWRFVVDGSGELDLGVLGASARAHRLSGTSIPIVAGMLEDAARRGREKAGAVGAMTPHQAAGSTSLGAPAQRRPADVAATVRVSLLGPVSIEAPGPLDPARRDLATEIAVALVLHPGGLHDAVLRASIWPRGVSDSVCEAALNDVVAWFGVGPDGRPSLARVDGRWLLGTSIFSDWDEVRRMAASAAGPTELATLLGAVELFRGRAFAAGGARQYGWLAFARAAREARTIGTVVTRRAAALLTAQQRTGEAERVLRRGLALVPSAELIWRDLLHLVAPRGPEPVAMVADEMYETLNTLRMWPEPESDALVQQLAPGHDCSRSA